MSYEEAIKYIRKVITEWGEWGKHHVHLVEALEVIVRHYDNGGKNP